jgi:hypothetical protein
MGLRRISNWDLVICAYIQYNEKGFTVRLYRGNPGVESGICTFSHLFAQLVQHEMHILDIDLHSDRHQAILIEGQSYSI